MARVRKKSLSKKSSKKLFSKTASKTHIKNINTNSMRGGYRL